MSDAIKGVKNSLWLLFWALYVKRTEPTETVWTSIDLKTKDPTWHAISTKVREDV